jgi:hypothetical protein
MFVFSSSTLLVYPTGLRGSSLCSSRTALNILLAAVGRSQGRC